MTHHWLKSFRIVSLCTALSRISGYMRDSALGLWIGPGPVLDAYFLVTRIASISRAFFAEGMVNALVPALLKEATLVEQKKLIGAMALRLTCMVIILCLIVSHYPTFILHNIMRVDAARMVYARDFLAVMFWYLLQINIASMMNALLHAYGRFTLPSFLPFIVNIAISIAAWGIGIYAWPTMALAYAVIIAGFFQIIVVATFTYWVFGSWRDFIVVYHGGVKNIFSVMLIALASTGIVQCSSLLDAFLAASLNAGAVSWIYYADRLVQLPLGILGVSMMTVLLPKLSSDHAQDAQESYTGTFCLGLECIMMLSMPMMLILAINSEAIVLTLFGYGKFALSDVLETGKCLQWMALALPAIMMNKLISASSYAKGHVTGMVQATALGVASNGIFAITMMHILQAQAMALGMLLGAWVNIFWLFRASSPVSFRDMWVHCRALLWIASWVVFTIIATAMKVSMHVSQASGVGERLATLTAMCLPATIFYAGFMIFMWRPQLLAELYSLAFPKK